MYLGRDSNSHAFQPRFLRPLCLPIPTPRHIKYQSSIKSLGIVHFQFHIIDPNSHPKYLVSIPILVHQSIANELNRSKGTISREVSRGSIIDFGEHVYSAAVAHQRANEQAQISHRKPLILEQNGMLKFVIPKLKKRWSPQKISTWLKKNKNMSVSHETIYQYIKFRPKES